MAHQNGSVRKRQLEKQLPDIASSNGATNAGKHDIATTSTEDANSTANTLNLLICVGGIYASL
jgi:UDP-galactose transporter B1